MLISVSPKSILLYALVWCINFNGFDEIASDVDIHVELSADVVFEIYIVGKKSVAAARKEFYILM